jgi:hypothetical protein
MRPKNLTFISIFLVILNCLQVVFWKNSPPEYETPLSVFALVVLLAFVIIYGFAKGQNWARIIIIIVSALVIPGPFISSDYGIAGVVVSTLLSITGIYLLYWLNTSPVKAYFKATTAKEFFIPKIHNSTSAQRITRLCATYFFLIVTLYLVTNFGEWSFKSSDTYFRISENLLVGFSILKCWRTVVRIFLYLQIILLIDIFIGGHGLKIINTMSLLVLFYADYGVAKHQEFKGHITSVSTPGAALPRR